MTLAGNPRRVRRQGSLKEVTPGRWAVRLSLGEVGNKRIRINKTVVGTKADAQRYLNTLIRRRDEGYLAIDRQRLGSWVEEWMALHCSSQSLRTRADSKGIFRRYLTKELCARRLSELTASEVQRWINDLSSRDLAPRTVRLAHSTLRSCLSRAVKMGKIPRNVARDVDLPKQRHVERVVLSPSEARRFLDAVQGDRWEAFFYLLLFAGLRPGEALGLTWDDVDGNTLRVRRALVRVIGHKPVLSSTKTGRSRAIPLGEEALAALKRRRVAQAKLKLQLGTLYDDRNLVFANEFGGFADDHNITARHYKPLLKRAGLPPIRLYDLRHSCATLLLAAGEHPKVVQERLGHSTITLTLDCYSHVIPGLQARASEKLESLLAESAASQVAGL